MLGREWGVYPFFPKNHHHLIKLLLVFGCAVCVQIYVLLFCFINNQSYSIVTSSVFKSQDFSFDVSLFNCRHLCFDWPLILPQSLPIFSVKKKARKPMSISIETVLNYVSHITWTSSQRNIQSFFKSVFVHHEINLSH